jgi:hypothetical protein
VLLRTSVRALAGSNAMKRLAAMFLLASSLGLSGAQRAAGAGFDVTLDVRFGSGVTGEFADVTVRETGDGALAFSIRLLDDLGPRADLTEFYFNLPSAFTGLEVELPDGFAVEVGAPTRGGAGARFDVAVSFGNGRGPKGNGTLQEVEFVIRADQPLAIGALLEEVSETSQGIETHLAAFSQGTRGGGPTVGTFVPEPATGLLLGLGLVAIAGSRSRRRSGGAGSGLERVRPG